MIWNRYWLSGPQNRMNQWQLENPFQEVCIRQSMMTVLKTSDDLSTHWDWGMVDGYLYLNYLTSFFPEHHVSSCHPPKKLAWWSGCTVHRGSPIAPIGCQACEWISISRRVAWQERPGSQAPKLYRQFSSFHLAKDSLFIFGEIKNGGAKIIELQIAIVAKLTRGRTCERTCWLGSPADLYAMVLLTGRRLSTTK